MRVGTQRRAHTKSLKRLLQSGLPIAFYSVLVILFTWPLIKEPGSHIPGTESDAYVHLWTFDWAGQAIASGKFTLYTNRIYYPVGVSLLSHNVTWFNIAVWLLLKPFLGPVAAYTLTVLLLLAFNGYAVHLLAKDITDSERASFLAGAIGTTWPFITTRLHHPNLIIVGFVPLAIRHIRRLILEGHKLDLVLAALFVGLIGVVRLQLLVMSVFLIGPYTLYLLIASKRFKNPRLLGQLALAVALACVILTPFVVPVIWYQSTRAYPDDLFVGSSAGGQADPTYYFLPSGFHPLWGKPLRESLEDSPFKVQFHVPFVGYTVLLLGFLGTAKRWKQGGIWGFSAIVIAALALGPVLVIGEKKILTLPYGGIYRQIITPILRDPQRFNVLLSIPLSVLAAIGGVFLWHRCKPSTQNLLCVAAIGLVWFEFAIFPFPSLPLSPPGWYNELARQEGEFGIADIPMDRQCEEQYMLYQLTHRKPLIEGHVSRPPREASRFIASVPLLDYLDRRDSRVPPYRDINISEQLDALHQANIQYLILHRNCLIESQIATWREWLVMPPYHEDDKIIVYQTDPVVLERAVSQSPQIGNDVQLVQTQLIPSQTVQTGWIQIPTHWFVSSALDHSKNTVCIALLDREDKPLQESCDYHVLNVPEDSRVEPGLLFTIYLVQVQPSVEEGDYQVVFYRPATNHGSPANSAVSAGDLAVSALPRHFDPPTPTNHLDITYGDEIALVGYDTEQTGGSLLLTLYWKALTHPSRSYKVFIHLIEEKTGKLVAQKDYVPCEWQYPTYLWQAGEYVHDYVTIDLSNVPSGEYQVQIGIYHPESEQRLISSPVYPGNAVPLMEIEHY